MSEQMIQAAGGIVFRRLNKKAEKFKILIVHRPRYNDWSLPKGKLLSGESWENAAKREVREETGYTVKINALAGPVLYTVAEKPKLVLFWRMQILRITKFKPTPEVDKIKWVTAKQALNWLSYDQEKELVSKVIIAI